MEFCDGDGGSMSRGDRGGERDVRVMSSSCTGGICGDAPEYTDEASECTDGTGPRGDVGGENGCPDASGCANGCIDVVEYTDSVAERIEGTIPRGEAGGDEARLAGASSGRGA